MQQVQRWRLSGLSMFQLSSLKEVKLMCVTPEWEDMERDDLSETTSNALTEWEVSVKQSLMPLLPLQLGRY